MLSSRSSKDEHPQNQDRIKMREEARKKRVMVARAAKLPHVSRNEFRVGDLGFVSRKVAPNADDNLSTLLKNGLIDYRELLGTFGTHEDYRYLGIDNVPGTPEVNINNLDENFRFPRHAPRVNGFKLVKEGTLSKNTAKHGHSIKQEPSSPKNVHSAVKDKSQIASNSPKQSNVSGIKEEPVSPKNRISNPNNETTAIQSNGEIIANKVKASQPKSKPPVLKMPSASKSSLNTNDKTQKAHPNKIESILKEMTEVLPPLTDIQTPVKSQDTRFPFPHLPVAKDNANAASIPSEEHNRGKTDEILKNDLITTSDDESDDDNERNRISKAEQLLGATKRRLSASSSSSSEGSSSESSSDSESSDSENESKEHAVGSGRKGLKRPSNSNFNNEPTTVTSPLQSTPKIRHGQLNSIGKLTPKDKVLREEELEKQVSPLNSISKDVRKEAEISPIANELPAMVTLEEQSRMDLLPSVSGMGQSLNSAVSPKNIDNVANSSRTDGAVHVDQELTNGVYESSPYNLYEGLIFEKPDDLIPPHFDPESFVDMMDIGRSPVRFDPMKLPMEEPDDLSAPSTVNLDSLNLTPPSGFGSDKSFHKEKVKGEKRIPRKSNTESEDNEGFVSTGGRRNSSSTPIHNKMQSKKDKEQEWFMKILSPNKKNFDLPYVNLEKLMCGSGKEASGTAKASTSGQLRVQIPLSKVRYPGKKAPRLDNSVNHAEPQKRTNVKGKDINVYPSKKKRLAGNDKVKSKGKSISNTVKNEKPRQSGGKDIEQIKSLMRELSNKASEDEEPVDVISTPSPLKSTPKSEARVSGKNIHGTPVSYIAKKEPAAGASVTSETADVSVPKERTREPNKKKSESQKGISRKRNSSSVSYGDTDDEPMRVKSSKKQKRLKENKKDDSSSRQIVEFSDDSNIGFKTPNSVTSISRASNNRLVVSINLSHLKRVPGNNEEEEEFVDEKIDTREDDVKSESVAELHSVSGPVWKPPPNIKIPRITKQPEDDMSQKGSKVCSESNQDCGDTDTSSNCSSSCKPSKDNVKSRKNRHVMEGRGVKRKECGRNPKNANPNVCGMCGSLQKDSGRDPIRLGAYKTSYAEYLYLGKRSKHIADCLDASERAPKYINAVLKYIQYLVGLEITGKTTTKIGFEEYICITSQCIDLVDFVVNQYGKKENNNISNYDSRFVYLCLRLQSVLYFKLYAAKKDSAARYSKLLSEYFKVHRSPHRVSIKGSTGTPSPMSPTSSHTGSVASFGSSVSNGSYEKMLNVGSVVSIPTETFERMQQYFTYTKYLLHGHRLWDDADVISNQCQEFTNIVSRRVGAITIQSSMLHLVDYISTGLQVIKDSETC